MPRVSWNMPHKLESSLQTFREQAGQYKHWGLEKATVGRANPELPWLCQSCGLDDPFLGVPQSTLCCVRYPFMLSSSKCLLL